MLSVADITYTGNPISATVEGSFTNGATYAVTYDDGSALAPTAVGTHTAKLTVSEAGVEKQSVTAEYSILKADGSVTNISDISKTYDGTAVSAPTFDKLSNGAAVIEYKVKGADDNTYTTTAPENAGNYIVRVTVAEGTNYKEASATAEFSIERAELTDVSVQQSGNLTYIGKALTPAVTTTATALNGEEVLFIYSADGTSYGTMPTFTDVGTYTIYYCAYTADNNFYDKYDSFTVTIEKATENAWTVAPSIDGWTYGDTAKAPIGEAKFGTVKVTYTGTANDGSDYSGDIAPTKAGSYTATFTVADTENYNGLSETVDFTIAKKSVTVTASDAAKAYGDSDPVLFYTNTSLVGQDELDVTVSRASGENVDTYTITASQEEGANPNYEITFKTGTFTIYKATLMVSAEDAAAVYGDAIPTYTVKFEGFKNGDDKDDLGGALDFLHEYMQYSDAGEYEIKPCGLTSNNYVISYNMGKLTVSPKAITVTIEDATSIYGEALAELKATDNGIVNGDTNVYRLDTTATSTSNVGQYAITGTALDGNYAITFVDGEYEITQRELTVTADAKSVVVNTELPTYTYKVEGLSGDDKFVTEPTLTCDADITVIGEYEITVSDADAGSNYTIKYVPGKLTVLADAAVDAAADYEEELQDYDPATVTSADKDELDEILSEINTILEDETTTDNGKEALEEVKSQVEALIKEITDAAEVASTENIKKVEDITAENVTPKNKADLEKAKADLETALEENSSNYTDDEKKAIEEEIKRIDAALAALNKYADSISPNTGVDSSPWLWFTLLFASGIIIFTITVYDRKRRSAIDK